MKKTLLMVFVLLAGVSYSQTKVSKKAQIQKEVKTGESVFMDEIAKARTFAPNGVVRCATTEYTNARRINGKAVSEKVFEDWLAPKIQEIKRLRQANMLPAVIRIPVVVHVIHNGDAVGTGENIADGQVLSQITVFNQDFRKLPGTPGDGAGVDTTIEFCLAQVDPNGNATNGIDRVNTGVASYTSMAAIEAAKAATIWDPTKYLNCWVFRFGGGMSSILGYAQFPTGSGLSGFGDDPCIDTTGGGGDATTDGVVCNYTTWGSSTLYPAGAFGAPYDKGRTMTHEVGHMFGLFHTFQGGCAGENYTSGDYCADTPAVASANGGCPSINSCPTGAADQVQNYMDYTDDTCMNMFTQDQKDRMLAVLLNSPRRDDLLQSNVCDAVPNTPYIQFKREACLERQPKSVIEGNGCSYTEFTIPLSIDMAPSANATVTFAIDAASESDMGDIQIMTPSVTFTSGSTADQNLVFRVLNDGNIEADEDLMITYTVTTSGNAISNPKGNVYTLTILNDDNAAVPVSTEVLFSENFDPIVNNFSVFDVDGDGFNWGINNEENFSTTVGFNGNFLLSLSWDGNPAPNGTALTPNNYIVTEALSIPSDAVNIVLTFDSGTLEDAPFHQEHYAVYVGTANTPAGISVQTPVFEETLADPQSFSTKTVNLSPSLAGQTVYLSFRHFNTTDMNTLIVDDISITYDVITDVQTATDMATAGQNNLKGAGLSNFRDSSSSNIIGGVQVNDASDYGCTDMFVSRSGTGAVQYAGFVNSADYAMSKQFTITPSNVVSGNTSITFYFTEAEIAGWESATGNSRTQLRVVKDGATQEAVSSASIGAFGSDVTISANFTTGVDGVYSFVAQSVLASESFEIDDLSIYPNPNNGTFNLAFAPTSNDVMVNVHDIRGRQILSKTYQVNGLFNETLQLNNAQSGIYLVTIQDGGRKVTKKIVVE